MYLKSPPKCFYGGEGIKNDRLVTYKIQYIHEEIAIIIPKGTPMNLLTLRKHKMSDFQKKTSKLKIGNFLFYLYLNQF